MNGKKIVLQEIDCNTASLDARQRAEIWRETVRSAFGSINVLPDNGSGNLYGQLKSAERGSMRFNTLHYRGQSHHRTPADIARLKTEYITLTRPSIGRLDVDYGGNRTSLQPGHIYLFNHAVPYFAKPHIEYATTSIAFSAAALRQRGVKPMPLQSLPAASRQGALINELASQITLNYLTWDDQEFSVLTEQLLDLIALFFFAPGARSLEETSVRAAHQQRAYGVIRSGFSDPDLTPAKIASACGISVSYLHNLFSATGTSVEVAVLTERLEHCKKLLSSPQMHHFSIGAIAYMSGFTHPAHFSRVFRQKMGCTPREFRYLALSRNAATAAGTGEPGAALKQLVHDKRA